MKTDNSVLNYMNNLTYEHLGWTKEYYVNGKYVGTIRLDNPDRDHLGYAGRTISVLMDNVILDNKKRLKKGISVITMLYPLCGRKLKKDINKNEIIG